MTNVVDAELVVGIVGRIGVDTKSVFSWAQRALHALHYKSHRVKMTEFLKTKTFDFELDVSSVEARYDSYIEACNSIRERAKRNDFFVSYAIEKIIEFRQKQSGNSADVPAQRTAYIIDQIKRPEEAAALRMRTPVTN